MQQYLVRFHRSGSLERTRVPSGIGASYKPRMLSSHLEGGVASHHPFVRVSQGLCHHPPSSMLRSSPVVSTISSFVGILENTSTSKWCENMTNSHANFCWEICQVAMGNTHCKEHLLPGFPALSRHIHLYSQEALLSLLTHGNMQGLWFPSTNSGWFVSSPSFVHSWQVIWHMENLCPCPMVSSARPGHNLNTWKLAIISQCSYCHLELTQTL